MTGHAKQSPAWVGIHGVPTGPTLWDRVPLPIRAVTVPEAATLEDLTEALLPEIPEGSVLLGHDLGGVLAAMLALRRPMRAVVLSGTALGPYWAAVRLTAVAPLHRYFYDHYGGRRFLAGSVAPERAEEVLAAFPPWSPSRMRAVARAMRPPADLARRLRAAAPVHLVWGKRDRWYPPLVAHALARRTGASVAWLDAGHLCMWEDPVAYADAVRAVIR